jgi:hypothetical protein
MAVELARANKQTELAAEIDTRRLLYARGQAYRRPADDR